MSMPTSGCIVRSLKERLSLTPPSLQFLLSGTLLLGEGRQRQAVDDDGGGDGEQEGGQDGDQADGMEGEECEGKGVGDGRLQ